MDGDGEASALLMGAVDYITKPIRPQVLTTRICLQLELINHRKHLEQLVTEKTKGLSEALDLLRLREDVTLNLLARVTELRDSDTGTHIERTTEFVRLIVTDLLENPVDGYEVTKEQATDIIKSAQLHDLGKIAVPDSILLKPDKLTPEEFDIIKTHTSEGKKLLSDTVESMKTAETRHIKDDEGNRIIKLDSFLATARDITYSHHEKWNGNGYPQGLSGADIPLAARIVALSDVYDALTSARPYKEAFSHEKSASIIYEDSGKHFDPYLVEVFKRHEKEFEEISKWSPRLHI
jgi:putative two-component system response regulator